ADRRPDVARVLAIERVARADEDGGRAAANRLRGAHRRMDPEAARDVVRGGDDAAAARIAADDEGLRAELRALELLDGCVERGEVEVRDDPGNGHREQAYGPGTTIGSAPMAVLTSQLDRDSDEFS